MRCPKCQYISFDSTDRCRNCGYEFALAPDMPAFDLPIQTGDEAVGPLDDFPITEATMPPSHAAPPDKGARGDSTGAPPRPITSVFDLPLFKDRPIDDDTPLVAPSAVPRQPLAVRRSSPVAPRAPRVTTDEPVFDLDALEPDAAPLRHVPWLPKSDLRPRPQTQLTPDTRNLVTAGLVLRLFAGIVDIALLGSICSVVLYITLEVCGLGFEQIRMLPLPPLAGFLLLLVGGYFILLTAAGGQTLGKMAAGIRVVPVHSEDRVSLGYSTVRAAGYLVSLLPLGLGLVPALVHADHRALHDRLADTRVVKA
jgi:uncharacterized RDD family membrane protein YckC